MGKRSADRQHTSGGVRPIGKPAEWCRVRYEVAFGEPSNAGNPSYFAAMLASFNPNLGGLTATRLLNLRSIVVV